MISIPQKFCGRSASVQILLQGCCASFFHGQLQLHCRAPDYPAIPCIFSYITLALNSNLEGGELSVRENDGAVHRTLE